MNTEPSAAPETCDLLIHARWVIPIETRGRVLGDHSVAIRGGAILAVLPTAEAKTAYRAVENVRLEGHALMPGLVNAHTHNPMTLLRGLADDLPLMTWLRGHIWPMEARFVGPEFVRCGIELAIAEMLRGGTTCCNESYFFPDVAAEAYADAGFRAMVGLPVIEFATAWAADADEYFDRALATFEAVRTKPLIGTSIAPHAPYTVSDASFERIAGLSRTHGLRVHCHVHETAQEVADSVREHGLRPLARLGRLGLLDERLIAVHMTELEPGEIARCAETGVHVVHCPESNLKLASGFCPLARLLAAGVNVALGTDGCASNNDLDMVGEMRTAALLAKAVANDAAACDAASILHAATLGGARALGWEDRIGSIEAGKRADLAAMRLDDLDTLPLYDPISQIVYAGNRRQFTDVWIDGRPRLRDGALVDVDVIRLRSMALDWQSRIANADVDAGSR